MDVLSSSVQVVDVDFAMGDEVFPDKVALVLVDTLVLDVVSVIFVISGHPPPHASCLASTTTVFSDLLR